MIKTPECHETFKKPVQQVRDAHGLITCHDEALKISLCTGITLQPAGQKESKMPQTNTKYCYGLGCDKVQDRLATPQTSTNAIISLASVDAPPSLLEVGVHELTGRKPLVQSDQVDSFKAHPSRPITSESHTYPTAIRETFRTRPIHVHKYPCTLRLLMRSQHYQRLQRKRDPCSNQILTPKIYSSLQPLRAPCAPTTRKLAQRIYIRN